MSVFRRAALALGAAVTTAVVLAAPAMAQPSEQDTTWMAAAHQSNLAEIAAGQAAQERATTDDVREMGATLIADHEALDADLTAAAQELGVDLPDAPSPEQQAALDEVMAQQGAAFDTAWIASQIAGHQATLAATEQEIAAGQEPSVVALAEAAAPVVQGHLDHLRQLAEEHGAPTTVPSGTTAPESAAPLGLALVAVGALAVAAATVLLRRRVRA